MQTLLRTDDNWAGLILRLTVAVVMFAHGAQKLFGWFGGNGYTGTKGFFTSVMQLPWIVAFLVIIGESIGSLALMAGFLTRITAASYIMIMAGAIATVHWPHGFFMNWMGKQPGEGIEFHLLVMGIGAALLVTGGGKWSIDGWLSRQLGYRSAGIGVEPSRYRATG